MKFTGVIATILVAVVLQMALARYMIGGRWAFDLVLVGVVYAALSWGPAAGILAGTLGGLVMDALSHTVLGAGGLVKTIVGFLAGAVGAQFVLARPAARTMVVAAATVAARALMFALSAVIYQHWPAFSWADILEEVCLNTIAGLVAFQGAESLSGGLAKGRASRRSSFSKRTW
jgi:rod shape-determining protein MreD